MQELILLKSAFYIIDQMFHKEIRNETKRTRTLYALMFGENDKYKNPEEMNYFIKNLMDPFNNSVDSVNNEFDSYYDEYYDLYDIKRDDNDGTNNNKEFNIFRSKSYVK
jgi:hypothetical protein